MAFKVFQLKHRSWALYEARYCTLNIPAAWQEGASFIVQKRSRTVWQVRWADQASCGSFFLYFHGLILYISFTTPQLAHSGKQMYLVSQK